MPPAAPATPADGLLPCEDACAALLLLALLPACSALLPEHRTFPVGYIRSFPTSRYGGWFWWWRLFALFFMDGRGWVAAFLPLCLQVGFCWDVPPANAAMQLYRVHLLYIFVHFGTVFVQFW